MRVLIIDDERLARDELRRLLLDHPWITVAGEAASVQDGLRQVAALAPELIFLDVQMPDGSGFDLLAALDNPPAVSCSAQNVSRGLTRLSSRRARWRGASLSAWAFSRASRAPGVAASNHVGNVSIRVCALSRWPVISSRARNRSSGATKRGACFCSGVCVIYHVPYDVEHGSTP